MAAGVIPRRSGRGRVPGDAIRRPSFEVLGWPPNPIIQYLDLVGNFWCNTNRPKIYAGDNFDLEKPRTLEEYRQAIRAGTIPERVVL